MTSHPSKEIISNLYVAGKPQVAWTTLIADLETQKYVIVQENKLLNPLQKFLGLQLMRMKLL